MILTVTLNAALDVTYRVGLLEPGETHRVEEVRTQAGGKGVNVARAVAAAGGEVVCVFPAGSGDPFVGRLHALGLRLATVPVATPVRTNYTLAEPDGTTTKLNEPGAPLDAEAREALTIALHQHAVGAAWVVLSGSLPPGTPLDWYADLVRSLREPDATAHVTRRAQLQSTLSPSERTTGVQSVMSSARALRKLSGVEAELGSIPAPTRSCR